MNKSWQEERKEIAVWLSGYLGMVNNWVDKILIEEDIDNMQNQHSAEVVLLGDFKEEKDENQNTILSGQVKNVGLKRADFSKITFTIYRNQSYDSMPVEYTAFINGSSVSFDSNAISTSSLFSEEVGDFSLVIPSDFGPFVSYTYRIDWEEYE